MTDTKKQGISKRSNDMCLKIIYASMSESLEEKVNYFIKDLDVINISFNTNSGGFYAYILYKK